MFSYRSDCFSRCVDSPQNVLPDPSALEMGRKRKIDVTSPLKLGNKETVSSIWGTLSLALSLTHSEESQLPYCELPCGKGHTTESWCFNQETARAWAQPTAIWVSLKTNYLSGESGNDYSPSIHFNCSLWERLIQRYPMKPCPDSWFIGF